MNKIRFLMISIVMFLSGISALAQSACNDLVTRALEKTADGCINPTPNSICYGNGLIFAQAQTGVPLTFATEGDTAPIDAFAGLTHSPLDEQAQIWGVSLMSLRANIPDSVPGQVVQIIVFGNVEVSDIQQSAFRFSTGIGVPTCDTVPLDGLMVRTPEGVAEVTLNINEVEISMGSTALISANASDGMTISMLDGNARVTAQGVTQLVTFSQSLNVPLMQVDENLVPAQPPSSAQTWDAANVAKAFSVYNTLNKIGTASKPIEPAILTPTQTLQPTTIVLPTNTPLPTITLTPSATFTPIPCTIFATSNSVITRVGPGLNRGTFVFLTPNQPITVTGKKFVNEELWWQLEKFEVSAGARSVNELWVAEADVTEQGDCEAVIDVDAPPIVRIPPTAAPLPTATPTTSIIATQPQIVPAVQPSIQISVEDNPILMGECTFIFVTIQFISAGYFDGPGFVSDTTIEGPNWDVEVCPPLQIGTVTYTLDAYSLTGNLVQRFVEIEVE